MSTIKGFIKRHAVPIYFALVFAISWGSWLLLTGGAPMRSDPRFMFIVLAAPVAPAIAGLLMTGLTAGKAGLSRAARPAVPVACTSALVWSGTHAGSARGNNDSRTLCMVAAFP
jgi:hypothetical protein